MTKRTIMQLADREKVSPDFQVWQELFPGSPDSHYILAHANWSMTGPNMDFRAWLQEFITKVEAQ
jgi:hypothetical protein